MAGGLRFSNRIVIHRARSDSPTFNADIAPILRAKCLTCHRQDGDAPFPLETFEQVRRRGSLIRQLTASGYMPPWKPSTESVAFLGDRRLSANEKLVIARWVEAGMPEGTTQPGINPRGNTTVGPGDRRT